MSEWKLVPVEPTEEMIAAAMQAHEDKPLTDWGKIVPANDDEIYRAMLAAAPAAPAQSGEAVAFRWKRRERDKWEYETCATLTDSETVKVMRDDGWFVEWLSVSAENRPAWNHYGTTKSGIEPEDSAAPQPAQTEQALTAFDADMVWPDYDGETFFHSIDDAVEYEVDQSWPTDGPLELKLQLGKRIPPATIRIFNITENGHEWEIVSTPPTPGASNETNLGS